MGMASHPKDWPDDRWSSFPIVRLGAIGDGWELFMSRWATWVLAAGLAMICHGAVLGFVSSLFGIDRPGGWGGFRMPLRPEGKAVQVALAMAVNGFFLGGMFRMACRQVRGLEIGVADLFSVVDVLPNLILGSLLYGLAIFAGFLCLVIPGLIASGVLMFTIPLIVDGGLSATDAVGRSWDALKGQMFSATLFHVVASLVAGVGTCFCCVGLLFTAPIYSLAIAALYRDFFLGKNRTFPGKPGPPPDEF